MSLMDYGLCSQTVTVYHHSGDELQRHVLENCYYAYEERLENGFDRKFLLVIPGTGRQVSVGDRILDGVGPEEVVWETFIPVNVPGLAEVAYVRPWFWEGEIHHMEAGR